MSGPWERAFAAYGGHSLQSRPRGHLVCPPWMATRHQRLSLPDGGWPDSPFAEENADTDAKETSRPPAMSATFQAPRLSVEIDRNHAMSEVARAQFDRHNETQAVATDRDDVWFPAPPNGSHNPGYSATDSTLARLTQGRSELLQRQQQVPRRVQLWPGCSLSNVQMRGEPLGLLPESGDVPQSGMLSRSEPPATSTQPQVQAISGHGHAHPFLAMQRQEWQHFGSPVWQSMEGVDTPGLPDPPTLYSSPGTFAPTGLPRHILASNAPMLPLRITTHKTDSSQNSGIAAPASSTRPSKTNPLEKAAHTFIAKFTAHFHACPPALASFEALCRNFNRKQMSETQLYVGVYRILYRTNTLDLLLKDFEQFLPATWKGADLSWFYKAIEKEQDDRQMSAGISSKTSGRTAKAGRPATATLNVRQDAFHGSASQTAKPGQASKLPLVREDKVMPAPRTTAKKVPSRGFKTNAGSLNPSSAVEAPVDRLPIPKSTTTEPTITSNKRRATSSPTPTPTEKKMRSASSDATLTQNVNISNRPYSQRLASEVDHCGPVFPTRHAVLARIDRPYIHAACGYGFCHPQDVKQHHRTNCIMRRRLRTTRDGQDSSVVQTENGDSKRESHETADATDEWDQHPSCQVGYTQIRYAKLKDGFVVLDQESWSKIEAANKAGMDFLRSKEQKVDMEAVDHVQTAGGITTAEADAAYEEKESDIQQGNGNKNDERDCEHAVPNTITLAVGTPSNFGQPLHYFTNQSPPTLPRETSLNSTESCDATTTPASSLINRISPTERSQSSNGKSRAVNRAVKNRLSFVLAAGSIRRRSPRG